MKYIKLLLLFLIMHVINTNAMHGLLAKRYEVKQHNNHRSNKLVLIPSKQQNQVKKIVPDKKDLVCYLHQGTFHLTFPKEIDKDILGLVITNTGQTLQEAAQIFSALICVNKFTYMHMDDDQRTLGWIKDLSKRFDETNLDVARVLCTRTGRVRCILQSGFDLGWDFDHSRAKQHLNDLRKSGLDVNFSYERDYPSPLLLCCSDLGTKNGAARWLIDNDADINICTSIGDNACMLALWNGGTSFMSKFTEHKDFKPNHQNHNGDTVLHYYLYRVMRSIDYVPGLGASIDVISECDAITKILAKGANPTLANKKKVTPLMLVRGVGREDFRKPIVELLEQAAIQFNFQEK